MYKYKLLIGNFTKLSLANYAALVQAIYHSLMVADGLTVFPDVWPDPYPKRAQFTTTYTSFTTAQAANDGSKTTRDQLKDAQAELTAMLKKLAPYFESVAKAANNPTLLDATGYPRRQPTVKPMADDVPAIPVLKLSHGKLTGAILGAVKRDTKAGSYEMQYCTGDPMVEANWKLGVTSRKATHLALPILPLGQLCYARARVIGSNGPGSWSAVASMIVT